MSACAVRVSMTTSMHVALGLVDRQEFMTMLLIIDHEKLMDASSFGLVWVACLGSYLSIFGSEYGK